MLRPVEPIDVVALFPALHDELLALLRRLGSDEWLRPTAVPGWSVKDVVAHLLDTDIRRLSSQRDGFVPPLSAPSPASYRELVALIDELNATWVLAARRISPVLLVELLALVGPQLHHLFATLDPLASARASVAWAGETVSANWFDLAREYTEKWHHQQHIREAIDAPLLTSREWLHPALDTFLRGLPALFRDVVAPEGTSIVLSITGPAGGDWTLMRSGERWQLCWGATPVWAARVELDQDSAWRLFTKGITPEQARSRVLLEGDEGGGERVLKLLAIMA
jgi:uncharacterized protein (TIGR03083 family)